MKPTTFTISLIFLLFSLSAFAQRSNDTEGQEISLFGTQSNDYLNCMPYGPANSLCAELTYFETNQQQNVGFCGTGLTNKELKKMSHSAKNITPVFSIIDLEGNLLFTSEVEMDACETWTCGVITTQDNPNDSGVTQNQNNGTNDPAIPGCGFGEFSYDNTPTKMCGSVCMDGLDKLQNGIYVAIFQTSNGTVTKKFSIAPN